MIYKKSKKIDSYIIRLMPGEDIKTSLSKFFLKNKLKSAFVVSGVGSLKKINLRLAEGSKKKSVKKESSFEILNLSGTISSEGQHLHMIVADNKGQVLGGHLLDENIIHTTLEVYIICPDKIKFKRQFDSITKYKELTF